MTKEADDQYYTRAYIHAMTGELAKMAKKADLPTLGYLLEMVEHEAAGLGTPGCLFDKKRVDGR